MKSLKSGEEEFLSLLQAFDTTSSEESKEKSEETKTRRLKPRNIDEIREEKNKLLINFSSAPPPELLIFITSSISFYDDLKAFSEFLSHEIPRFGYSVEPFSGFGDKRMSLFVFDEKPELYHDLSIGIPKYEIRPALEAKKILRFFYEKNGVKTFREASIKELRDSYFLGATSTGYRKFRYKNMHNFHFSIRDAPPESFVYTITFTQHKKFLKKSKLNFELKNNREYY